VMISKTELFVTVLSLANHRICALEGHAVSQSYSANSFILWEHISDDCRKKIEAKSHACIMTGYL